MKGTKRITALVLSLIMAIGMVMAVSAASITITPNGGRPEEGTDTTSYTYYELLHASISGDSASYYLTSGETDLKEALEATGAFTFTASADGSQFIAEVADNYKNDGKALAAAVNTDPVKAAALKTGTFQTDGSEAKAEDLEAGYYLVASSLGTNLVLETLKDEEVKEKNEYITSVKTEDKSNLAIDGIVTYTIQVTIPKTTKVGELVTVHDTMDDHLAMVEGSLKAYVGTGASGTEVSLEDGTKKDGETFAKSFAASEDIISNGTVTLTYQAKLKDNAETAKSYLNTAYANTSSFETKPTTVQVYTFGFKVLKNFVDASDDFKETAQATFELQDENNKPVSLVETDATNHIYRKATSTDDTTTTVITADGLRNAEIVGLEKGTYYLVEKTTAAGYNLLTEPVKVEIKDTTATDGGEGAKKPDQTPAYEVFVNDSEAAAEDHEVKIDNQKGSVLPSTGGMGTTIFYIVGIVLILGAVILIVSKKMVRK